ncbi:glucan endo-1,3-beta-D-glucosidase-like, partial [Olea europaea subsp. europaea]
MAVLGQFSPPSSGAFHVSFVDALKDLLKFQSAHGSPFMINAFPFYYYENNRSPETLAFCLFQPNSGQLDLKSNITYMNMFDVEVDVVRSTLNAMGYKDMEIIVAHTGWPYEHSSNEVGPSLE